MKVIEKIENRFLEVAGFCKDSCDLSEFPLVKGACPQSKTDKEKSALHGEVFTPLWFVDKMILGVQKSFDKNKTTLDLCAGFGQFTIRMLRFLQQQDEKAGKKFWANNWLKKKHSFSEYQVSSTYKILYIFGLDINLFIGDANQLSKLEDTDKGVLFYNENLEKWLDITKDVRKLFGSPEKFDLKKEEKFVKGFEKLKKKRFFN